MSEQNRYQISCDHKHKDEGWQGWVEDEVLSADTWEDAIRGWIDYAWGEEEYTVVSVTSSEDGKSGIIVAQFDSDSRSVWVGVKIKATLVED